jgi:hypothetical protein
MAISRASAPSPNDSSTEMLLTVNNGDLVALRDVAKKFSFRDEESVLRFALAVLSRSATRSLTITDKDGQRVSLNPSAELLKPPDDQSTS